MMKTLSSWWSIFFGLPESMSCRRRSRLHRSTKMAAMPLLFLLLAAVVRGQSALDGFDPNANGPVNVVVVQPDGKILLGGAFTTFSPNGGVLVTRNRIARLNPDGTLDSAFNPNANGTVFTIAVQADGKILAGGQFTGIGGQTRNYFARLDAITGLADSFDPDANNPVNSIVVQSDGNILAGGQFNGANSIGGQMRNYIARLDATTGLVDSFDPNASGQVTAIAVQADGKILVGGDFTGIGGQTRNFIARLDSTTGLADSFNPDAIASVSSIAVQADGKILAGGAFTSIGGQVRNHIARLDAATGLADSFNPNANAIVNSIAVQPDGKILAGGVFSGVNSIGGQARNRIARLDRTTGLADSFDPNAGNFVNGIAVQPDGKVLVGGGFTTLAPNGGATVTRKSIARLETDGRLDQTLDLGAVGSYVLATAVQPDGKILIGGRFGSVLGVPRRNIARLNTDGTLDTAFDPNANYDVFVIVVQADGKILVGGDFRTFFGTITIGGQTRNCIARLDATTGLADSFNPNANGAVYAIALQADGKILTGGRFFSNIGENTIGGQPRNRIARLDATTGAADSFDPNASNIVYEIVVQADGKILAGGAFTSIGGQPRNRIARLDATTGLADSFNPNASDGVLSIVVQRGGKILTGGQFSNIGGQTRNHIARLDAITGLADSFDPNANDIVSAIIVQADGKILAAGGFSGPNSIGGQARNGMARLESTTGLADSFDPNANGGLGGVYSIAVQADGKILVGGDFTTLAPNGGAPVTRNRIARLAGPASSTPTPTPRPATLGNISTRLQVGTGANVMIGGFIVQGSAPKRVLIRAAGPSLTQFGVPQALANPRLELHDTVNTIGMNDNWQTTQIGGVITSRQVAEIQNSGLAPRDALECALIATLVPGNYTAIVQGVNNGTGVGIVEVYDLNATSGSVLGNIATRGFVQTGDNAMIGGFIVVTQLTRVIIRAIGPSLTPVGVPDALANPRLELHDATTNIIARNDDWQTTQIFGIITSDQVAEIQNSQLAPTNPAESAIIATLQPGNYTAIVRGVNDTTGNALVEVYALQ